jgi:glycosyltransferase involved in cell wall biosynthesis
MKVLHIVPTLCLSGAERLLTSLAIAQSKDSQSSVEIFTLLDGGRQMEAVRAAGVPVREFELGGSMLDQIRTLIRLRRAVRAANPDIIHAWMYHSALLASMFAPNRKRVLIAIHHTNPFDPGLPLVTRVIAFGCALASRLTGAVVYVASTAKVMHERIGFSKRKGLVVHVGVDEKTMAPATPETRTQSRQRLGVPQDAIVVVHVARYHRNKDQPTLLDAFERALAQVPGMYLILVGEGLNPANKELSRLILLHGIQDNVALIGELEAPLEAFQAADIFCLSSMTEAFPVSLVEALQCGLVPVVTDVGECRSIVGGTGFVVPPDSAQDLADGLVKAAISASSRSPELIREQGLKFGLSQMCAQYEDVYASMIALSSPAAQTRSSRQSYLR